MDLKLLVDDRIINVEVQFRSSPYFRDRVAFHWSKLFTGDIKSGDEFSELKQSIVISIVNFKLFDCEDYHSHFTIMETERHEILTDKCSIHFFELPKIAKAINKDDKKTLWLQLINAETKEEIDMLAEAGVEPIQKAVYIVREMNEDEKIREMVRLRENAWLLENLSLKGAREEGRNEVINKMRSFGISEDDIASILSENTVL